MRRLVLSRVGARRVVLLVVFAVAVAGDAIVVTPREEDEEEEEKEEEGIGAASSVKLMFCFSPSVILPARFFSVQVFVRLANCTPNSGTFIAPPLPSIVLTVTQHVPRTKSRGVNQ